MAEYSAHLLIFSIIMALHFSDAMMVDGRKHRVEKIQNNMKSNRMVQAFPQVEGNRETMILNPKSSAMVQELGRYAVNEKRKQAKSGSITMLFYEVFSATFKSYRGGTRYRLAGKVIIRKDRNHMVRYFGAEVVIKNMRLGHYSIIALHLSDAMMVDGRKHRVEKIQNDMESNRMARVLHKFEGNRETEILNPKNDAVVQELGQFAVNEIGWEAKSASTMVAFYEVFSATVKSYKGSVRYRLAGKVIVAKGHVSEMKYFNAEVVIVTKHLGQFRYLKSFNFV